jgi:hypothetical protein
VRFLLANEQEKRDHGLVPYAPFKETLSPYDWSLTVDAKSATEFTLHMTYLQYRVSCCSEFTWHVWVMLYICIFGIPTASSGSV